MFRGEICGNAVGAGEMDKLAPEIIEQEAGADPRGFENDRQSAARMRASADQVHAVDVFETVARTQMQHLTEGMSKVERRALVDLVFRVPVIRRNDTLETDAPFNIFETGLGNLAQHSSRETARALLTNRRSDAGGLPGRARRAHSFRVAQESDR